MWISKALTALFPAMCLGCGRVGTPLCDGCAERTSRPHTIDISGLRVHSAGRAYLVRTTMDRVAQRFAARPTFVRVRRSAIVNVAAIATLERYGKSAFVVHLQNGTKIISSRYYQPALRRLLQSAR